jgi:ligand-binding sensor domain-containing protein
MKYGFLFSFFLSVVLFGCSQDEDELSSNVSMSDTIPCEIIHDVAFNSADDLWILGYSYDPEAKIPAYSSMLPFKTQLVKKKHKHYLLYDRIPKAKAMHFDKADHLLILCLKNLMVFREGVFTVHSEFQLADDVHFTSFVIDDLNQLWLAGYGTGIYKYDGTEWNVYNTENSALPENSIHSLTTNGKTVWAMTLSKNEIIEIKNNQMIVHPLPQEVYANHSFYFMEADIKGTLWLTSENRIFALNKAININTDEINNRLHQLDEAISIRRIKADQIGNVYVLCASGSNRKERYIIKITGDLQIQNIEIPQHLRSNVVYAMAFDSENNLWIATPEGMVRFD